MRDSDDLSQFSVSSQAEQERTAALSGVPDQIELWFEIVTLMEEARTTLTGELNATLLLASNRPSPTKESLFGMPTEVRMAPARPVADPLSEARGRLILKLSALKTLLYAALSDVEAGCLYAAMVFFIDEQILREPVARTWPLLQQELFDFTDGGERFFDLVDQRLATAQTAPVVFEVLYYLLADYGKHKGFQGRYASHLEQIAQYRRRLQERINAPTPAPRRTATRRGPEKNRLTAGLSEPPLRPIAYYGLAALALLLIGLLTVWLSDVPDLGASRTRTAVDTEATE